MREKVALIVMITFGFVFSSSCLQYALTGLAFFWQLVDLGSLPQEHWRLNFEEVVVAWCYGGPKAEVLEERTWTLKTK
jgi:hypothetical protein